MGAKAQAQSGARGASFSKRGEIPNFNFRSIWTELNTAEWRQLLIGIAPNSKWETKGDAFLGRCPFPGHSDSTASCWIKPNKGICKCFGCGRVETNPISLVATLTSSTWANAALYLIANFNLTSLSKKQSEALGEIDANNISKKVLAHTLNSALMAMAESYRINGETAENAWAVPCLKFLRTRGIPLTEYYISNLPIGILPPMILLKGLLGPTSGGAFQYIKDYLTANNIGSLVFFYHEDFNTIKSFRLRNEFMSGTASKKKTIIKLKDPIDDGLGFFGLANFASKFGGAPTNSNDFVVVEGEFDVLAHLVVYLEKQTLFESVISNGGGANYSLDNLAAVGAEKCYLVMDHPTANGEGVALELLKNTSMPCEVFKWPADLPAKDPDSAIKELGWDTWYSALTHSPEIEGVTSTKRTNFVWAHIWAKEKFLEERKSVDQDDLASTKRIALKYAKCLLRKEDLDSYLQVIQDETGIKPSRITEKLETSINTEPGLIAAIKDRLEEEFSFVGITNAKADLRVVVWNKTKRESRYWKIANHNDFIAKLELDIGNPIHWVEESLGVPRWIKEGRTGKDNTQPLSILDQNTKLRNYIQFAAKTIFSELPDITRLRELKAGAHYLSLKYGEDTVNVWILINGSNIYLGIFDHSVGALVWEELRSIKMDKYFFNTVRETWSKEIQSVEDLSEGNSIDMKEPLLDLASILNEGWGFSHQQLDSLYLAGAMAANTICNSFPKQLYTIINGSRGSGKSKLLALLTSADPELRIVEAAFGMDSYTSAGFRKEMNNCALGACLDEFEDNGVDPHSNQVRAILRDIRGLTSNPEAKILRGNAENSEATEYILKCQVWAASINYLREEADISRFVQVHTKLQENKASPHNVMLSKYGPERVRAIRRSFSLGMFKEAPGIEKAIRKYRAMFSENSVIDGLANNLKADVPTRFLDSILIVASILELAGFSGEYFILDICSIKAQQIRNILNSTQNSSLLDKIFSLRVNVANGLDRVSSTIRKLMSSPASRPSLNEAEFGVKAIEGPGSTTDNPDVWILIIWPDLMPHLSQCYPELRNESMFRLKQLCDSDKEILVPASDLASASGLIRAHLPMGIEASGYSAYNLSKLLTREQAKNVVFDIHGESSMARRATLESMLQGLDLLNPTSDIVAAQEENSDLGWLLVDNGAPPEYILADGDEYEDSEEEDEEEDE